MSALLIRDDYAGVGWAEATRILGLDELGIEWDGDACATRAACGYRTIRADLSRGAPLADREWAGYIASPPCQTFSTAGSGEGREHIDALIAKIRSRDWTTDGIDDRTAHVLHTAHVCSTIDAHWIALEQVRSVLPIWEAIAGMLQVDGWETWTGVLCAADYGVPQTRRRAVLIANRHRRVSRPIPTHAEHPGLTSELPWISWGEALDVDGWMRKVRGAGMVARHGTRPDKPSTAPAPTVTAGVGGSGPRLQIWTDGRRSNEPVTDDRPAPTVTAGAGMRDRWIIDRRQNSRGPRGSVVPAALVPDDRPAPTVTTNAGGSRQWQMMPATTVTCDPRITARSHHTGSSTAGAVPILEAPPQWDGPVSLTVAQAARLQSFRADLPWQGSRGAQHRQIGNAVPPLLGVHIIAEAAGIEARYVADQLRKERVA